MSEDRTITVFDRMMGSLHGLPDVVHTNPATVQVMLPLIGVAQTYTVQTFRKRDGEGDKARSQDTCFVQAMSAEGLIRIAFPPQVCDTIARQREALGTKTRKKSAKRVAAERKAAGIVPGFMKQKGGKG